MSYEYSTRDVVDDDLNRIGREVVDASNLAAVAKLLVQAVVQLARATADVADAVRKP